MTTREFSLGAGFEALLNIYTMTEHFVSCLQYIDKGTAESLFRTKIAVKLSSEFSRVCAILGQISDDPVLGRIWNGYSQTLVELVAGSTSKAEANELGKAIYILSGITWQRVASNEEAIHARDRLLVTVHPLALLITIAQLPDWLGRSEDEVLAILGSKRP